MWFDDTVVEAIRDAVPEWLAIVFLFVSYLGSIWVIAPAVVFAYWFGDRRHTSSWVGVVGGAYALMASIKPLFSISRPAVDPPITADALPFVLEVAYAPAVELSSTSFPSGHAIAATIFWGLLASDLRVGTRRSRVVWCGSVVALVSLSRVALGVHYVGDVLAGMAIGLCYLGVSLTARKYVTASTSATFAVAASIAVFGLAFGRRLDALVVFGAIVGALAAWHLLSPPLEPTRPDVPVLEAAIGLVSLAAVAGTVLVLDGYPPALGGVALLAGAVVVGLPGVRSWNRHSWRRPVDRRR